MQYWSAALMSFSLVLIIHKSEGLLRGAGGVVDGDVTFIGSRQQQQTSRRLKAGSILSVSSFYFSSGNVQEWVVPDMEGVATFAVEAYGAQGGCFASQYSDATQGGLGGYLLVRNISAASLVGQTLYVYIGGQDGTNGGGRVTLGNGGGVGFTPGGGATDMRTVLGDLSSRILVAGGGGGAGAAAVGGHGGGVDGGEGGSCGTGTCALSEQEGGRGGNQAAGGQPQSGGGNKPGTFGQGGNGNYESGGGGGGYYGGAGGFFFSGGGGGSSYADPRHIIDTNAQGIHNGDGFLLVFIDGCKVGYIFDEPTQSCIACGPGSYNPLALQTTCITCPGGSYQPLYGQSAASSCRVCTNKTVSTPGQASCFSMCPPGTSLSSSSSSACNYCASGQFSSSPNLSPMACINCPVGYSSTNNATFCSPIPPPPSPLIGLVALLPFFGACFACCYYSNQRVERQSKARVYIDGQGDKS